MNKYRKILEKIDTKSGCYNLCPHILPNDISGSMPCEDLFEEHDPHILHYLNYRPGPNCVYKKLSELEENIEILALAIDKYTEECGNPTCFTKDIFEMVDNILKENK